MPSLSRLQIPPPPPPAPGAGGLIPASVGLRGDQAYLESLLQRAFEEARARSKGPGREVAYSRCSTTLEAAAAAARLVLIGPAGSGKTTFARYLALNLAGEILGRDEANLRCLEGGATDDDSEWRTWPHGTPLPVFVELHKLVRSRAFLKGEKGHGMPAARLPGVT